VARTAYVQLETKSADRSAEMPGVPDAPSCGWCESGGPCACTPSERALHAWLHRKLVKPMTPEQRAWCLDEIGSIEGYNRADYEGETDGNLARTVLSAWLDLCRDKGLV
jgi:hypothetical protein